MNSCHPVFVQPPSLPAPCRLSSAHSVVSLIGLRNQFSPGMLLQFLGSNSFLKPLTKLKVQEYLGSQTYFSGNLNMSLMLSHEDH